MQASANWADCSIGHAHRRQARHQKAVCLAPRAEETVVPYTSQRKARPVELTSHPRQAYIPSYPTDGDLVSKRIATQTACQGDTMLGLSSVRHTAVDLTRHCRGECAAGGEAQPAARQCFPYTGYMRISAKETLAQKQGRPANDLAAVLRRMRCAISLFSIPSSDAPLPACRKSAGYSRIPAPLLLI